MSLSFSLFVYGTLKQGFRNYEHHCKTATRIEKAYTWGRLYELDAGFPALAVPESSIQAVGTNNYKMDAVNQGKHLHFEQPSGDWDMVEGELIYFSQPDVEIPPLDDLEQFSPEALDNLYQRVLMTCKTEEGLVNAWTYIINDEKQTGKRLSLNKEGVVNWNKPPLSYISLKGHAANATVMFGSKACVLG